MPRFVDATVRADLPKLFAGGLAGLLVWEVFANPITTYVVGGPLQPPALVISLVKNLVGIHPGWPAATALHYLTGIVAYPLGYYALTRRAASFGTLVDGTIWGMLTWVLALGVFASLAGLPFMLNWVKLTWFSLIGHVVYAVVAAWVFETWRRRGVAATT